MNATRKEIFSNILRAAIGLVIFGIGDFLTIKAQIGALPWDTLIIGTAGKLNVNYGLISVCLSVIILIIDILLHAPIGVEMIMDAIIVGVTVDVCGAVCKFASPDNFYIGVLVAVLGMILMAVGQLIYMPSALGCGPKDSLLVELSKRLKKIPIGFVELLIMAFVVVIGWMLDGPIGWGTLICAFITGPIMQTVFSLGHFKAENVKHQNLIETARVLVGK